MLDGSKVNAVADMENTTHKIQQLVKSQTGNYNAYNKLCGNLTQKYRKVLINSK